jgi:hypothetical protein
VFKDIGVPNAEEHFVKAQLVFKIDRSNAPALQVSIDAG